MSLLQVPSVRSSCKEAEEHLHGMAVATRRACYFLMLECLVQLVEGISGDLHPIVMKYHELGTFHEDAKLIIIRYSSLSQRIGLDISM